MGSAIGPWAGRKRCVYPRDFKPLYPPFPLTRARRLARANTWETGVTTAGTAARKDLRHFSSPLQDGMIRMPLPEPGGQWDMAGLYHRG
jgi:hypothetical protein